MNRPARNVPAPLRAQLIEALARVLIADLERAPALAPEIREAADDEVQIWTSSVKDAAGAAR